MPAKDAHVAMLLADKLAAADADGTGPVAEAGFGVLGDSTAFTSVRANCLLKKVMIVSRAVFSSFSSSFDFSPRRARAALTVRAQ